MHSLKEDRCPQQGTHFITVDPLFKFRTVPGSKVFDVLIYNKETKSAILIECKSSIGNAARDVLKPAKEQIQNAINHKKDLEEEIGGQVV